MAKRFSLEANVREEKSSAIRRGGGIPAVLYGHGVDAMNLALDAKKFQKTYSEAGSTSLITLTVDGKDHPVFVREIQRHPVRSEIIHVDLYQVKMDEKIRAAVPLNFVNDAPAVRDGGGTLVRSIDEIEVSALPLELPHDIEVDISGLDDFEKVIRIENLNIPEGVEVHLEADEAVASVQAPRTQEQIDEELAAEVSEDVESVEGVADKEEPEDGEEGAEAAEAQEESKEDPAE